MKKNKLIMLMSVLIALLGLVACQSNSSYNTHNTVEWVGAYAGAFPCDNCSGIQTRITLYDSNEFAKTDTYVGSSDKFTEHGEVVWEQAEQMITLLGSETQSRYKLTETGLLLLGANGEPVTNEQANPYQLKRIKEIQ